jgi:hypothetical protein
LESGDETRQLSHLRKFEYLVETAVALQMKGVVQTDGQLAVVSKTPIGPAILVGVLPSAVDDLRVMRDMTIFDKP